MQYGAHPLHGAAENVPRWQANGGALSWYAAASRICQNFCAVTETGGPPLMSARPTPVMVQPHPVLRPPGWYLIIGLDPPPGRWSVVNGPHPLLLFSFQWCLPRPSPRPDLPTPCKLSRSVRTLPISPFSHSFVTHAPPAQRYHPSSPLLSHPLSIIRPSPHRHPVNSDVISSFAVCIPIPPSRLLPGVQWRHLYQHTRPCPAPLHVPPLSPPLPAPPLPSSPLPSPAPPCHPVNSWCCLSSCNVTHLHTTDVRRSYCCCLIDPEWRSFPTVDCFI